MSDHVRFQILDALYDGPLCGDALARVIVEPGTGLAADLSTLVWGRLIRKHSIGARWVYSLQDAKAREIIRILRRVWFRQEYTSTSLSSCPTMWD